MLQFALVATAGLCVALVWLMSVQTGRWLSSWNTRLGTVSARVHQLETLIGELKAKQEASTPHAIRAAVDDLGEAVARDRERTRSELGRVWQRFAGPREPEAPLEPQERRDAMRRELLASPVKFT